MTTIFAQGNVCLRAEKYADAIAFYRRALQEQPELGSLIRFNLEFSEKRIRREEINQKTVFENAKNIRSDWISHEELQRQTDQSLVVLGGVVVGYSEKNTHEIPRRVSECVEIFCRIAQIQDFHGLHLFSTEDFSRPLNSLLGLPVSDYIKTFSHEKVCIGSVWYTNARDLRLSIEVQPNFNRCVVLRGYQYDPIVDGGLVLIGEDILPGKDCQLIDLELVNPYLPILIALTSPEGQLLDACLIPYPSLLPGGLHEHECYLDPDISKNNPTYVAGIFLEEHLRALEHQEGWALGLVQVDIREAIGTEPLLSLDMKEWLWSIFSVRIRSWSPPKLTHHLAEYWQEVFTTPSLMRTAEKFASQTLRERQGQALLCPPGAIPSLRALTASRAAGSLDEICGLSEFILIQKTPTTQRSLISWPEAALSPERALAQDGAVHVPMVLVGKDKKQNSKLPSGVSAILTSQMGYTNPAQLVMPLAPDSSFAIQDNFDNNQFVDIVVTAANMPAAVFSALLESLALQHRVVIRKIVITIPTLAERAIYESILKRNFDNRYFIIPESSGDNYKQRMQRVAAVLKEQPDDGYITFINQALIVHDPRTLAFFIQALATPKAITVSAPLIGKIVKKSKSETEMIFSGIFSVQATRDSEPEWDSANILGAIPRTTLPVLSHGDAIFMITAKDWKKMGSMSTLKSQDEQAAHEYSARLSESNRIHLLVPHITVELHTPPIDNKIPKNNWKSIAGSASHANAVRIEILPS